MFVVGLGCHQFVGTSRRSSSNQFCIPNFVGFPFVRFGLIAVDLTWRGRFSASAADRAEHGRRVNRAVIVEAALGHLYHPAGGARREVARVEGRIIRHDAVRVTITVAP